MSKKDYQAIAQAIYKVRRQDAQEPCGDHHGHIAEALAEVFKADNSAFDRSRFLEACETGMTKGMAR